MWRIVILCITAILKGWRNSLTRWHFLAVPVVVGLLYFCSNISCITFRADLSSVNLERLKVVPLSPGLSVPLSIQVLNYWQITRTGKVCLSGHTWEEPMLLECCGSAAWPGPWHSYCVRNTQATFWGHISGFNTWALIVSQPSICWSVEASRLHFPPTLLLRKLMIVTLVFVLCK